MASRLSVVIMQSPKERAERQQLEERLLIELMAARGLDPILIRPADQLTAEQTDLLPLQRAQADFVVCAWADPQETRDTLGRLGISTRPTTSQRDRFHVFDLRQMHSVETFVSECKEMLKAIQTRVVQIGAPGSADPPVPSPPAIRAAKSAEGNGTRRDAAPTGRGPAEQTGRREAELDQLVNQLNDEMI